MGDIAAFIAARLDEAEASSREVHEARVCSGCSDGWEAGFDPDRCDCGYPARVERAGHLLRAILARYEDCLARMEDAAYPYSIARDQAREYEDFVLPNLAAIWADHPDYDEAWKP